MADAVIDALASAAVGVIVGLVFSVAYVVTELRWLRRYRSTTTMHDSEAP